jgi:hypothetical protein
MQPYMGKKNEHFSPFITEIYCTRTFSNSLTLSGINLTPLSW